MNVEEIRDYCLSKKGSKESFPFDEVTLVFKVGDKMFALLSLDTTPLRLNLKCIPEQSIILREQYEYVVPGYHMNKKHWNSVLVDDLTPSKLIKEWIDHSYNLIFNSLSKKVQKELLS